MQKSYMQNNNNSKTKGISLEAYILAIFIFLSAFVLTGAICLEHGYEFTGLGLMLIGIVILAVFNATIKVNERSSR